MKEVSTDTIQSFNTETVNPADIAQLISFVTAILPAKKLFLLKADANHCHLLVLLPGNMPHTFREYQRRICSNVVLWCLHTGEADKLLQGGHLYYSLHCTADTLVYDTGSTARLQSSRIHPSAVVEKARAAFHRSFTLAQAFLSGAQYYTASGQARAAAFSLHQAAEQALRALLLAVMQYNGYGHDLRGLLRRYDLLGPALFAQGEQPLLTLLNNAYMHTRYKNGYAISEATLMLLVDRITTLHAQVQQCFAERIIAFEASFNS